MKRFSGSISTFAAFVLLAILVAGCDGFNAMSGVEGDSEADRHGSFKLHLTDAPFPYDLVAEANVWIDSVDIVSGDDAVRTLTSYEPAEKINLLDLQNGVTTLLFDGDLEADTYSQVRLYVSSASIVLNDEQVFDLKVPSERIRVLLQGLTIAEGIDTELTLDFDVGESFVVQGNPDTPAGIKGFILKPVVKLINLTSTPDDGDEGDDADEASGDEGSDDEGADDEGSDDEGSYDGSEDEGSDDGGSDDEGADDTVEE